LHACLGEQCPSMEAVKENIARKFQQAVAAHVAAITDPSGQVPS
jgi:hypothetical protein